MSSQEAHNGGAASIEAVEETLSRELDGSEKWITRSESVGTVSVCIPEQIESCKVVASKYAPDGWEIDHVSLHSDGEMLVTFGREDR